LYVINSRQLEQEIKSLPDIEKLRLLDVILQIWTNLIPRLIASGQKKPESAGLHTRLAAPGPFLTKK
jgi:hypothetical protein